jgi:hypothetical protein
VSIFKKKKRFILSDESINSYGFVVSTEGIDTARFEANPVMLDGHVNDNERVLGAWDDIIVDKTNRLSAVPFFDTSDENAKKIAAKVDGGFIRGASIGIKFSPDDMKKRGSQLVLTKCELLEASIVAVPSNKNALKLYNTEGQLMKLEDVNQLCMSLNNNEHNFKTKMDKQTMQLSLAALAVLGFEAAQVENLQAAEINAAILAMSKQNETLTAQVAAFELKEKQDKDAETARLAQRNATLVDAAIKAGKITADKREHFMKMAEFDYQLAEQHLTVTTGKASLGTGLHPISGAAMTMDEFQKLTPQAQLQWKTENLDAYKALVQQPMK